MNLKTIKSPKEITLSGVTVEFERKDNTVKAIIIRDSDGGLVIIRENGYSGIDVLIPAPRKLVARWRVIGRVADTDISESFTQEYEANARIGELGLAGVTAEKFLTEE